MALKIFVKVGNINNLSDARYCAGMGVDMLGFCIEPSHPYYVGQQTYNEMIGWLSGVKFVAEFTDSDLEQINELLDGYSVHAIQTESKEVIANMAEKAKEIDNFPIEFIFKSKEIKEIEEIASEYSHFVRYFLLSDAQEHSFMTLRHLAVKCNLILEGVFETNEVEKFLSESTLKGFALQATHEIAPGLQDFDKLATILETLEIE